MTSVVLRNGTAFSIEGAQSPGGALTISDPSSGKAILAANSGDYVYPSDVRFNAETSRLYVKTQGLAGGIWPTTDLFEYDLSERRLLQRADAGNAKLLVECQEIVGQPDGSIKEPLSKYRTVE